MGVVCDLQHAVRVVAVHAIHCALLMVTCKEQRPSPLPLITQGEINKRPVVFAVVRHARGANKHRHAVPHADTFHFGVRSSEFCRRFFDQRSPEPEHER